MEGTRENVRAAMKRYDDDRSRTLDLGEFTQMVRDLPSRAAAASPTALALCFHLSHAPHPPAT